MREGCVAMLLANLINLRPRGHFYVAGFKQHRECEAWLEVFGGALLEIAIGGGHLYFWTFVVNASH